MTRINAGINPIELCDSHLLAEHREITRIPNTIKSGRANVSNLPSEFKLGTGHVRWFYDKLKYLHIRYTALHDECIRRKFNVQDNSSAFDNLPQHLYNDWFVYQVSRRIVIDRLNTRLDTMKNIKYKGQTYTSFQYVQ